MKKIAMIFIFTALIFLNVFAAEQVLEANSLYQPSNNKLYISGLAEVSGDITISVLKEDTDLNDFTPESLDENVAVFYMTSADVTGKFSVSIGLPAVMENGVYKVIVRQNGVLAESNFSFAGIDNSSIEKLNDAKSPSEVFTLLTELGADEWDVNKYGENISRYLFDNRLNNYDADSYLKSYTAVLAIEKIKSGMDAAEILRKYSAYLDIDYKKDFSDYSESVCTEIERLIRTLKYDNNTITEFYCKCLLLAQINKAESVNALQEITIENADILGINLSDYNKIKTEYKKAMVFEKLIDKDFESFKDFKDAFNDEVDNISEQKNNGGGGLGGSGGGGSSKGSYGGSFSADNSADTNIDDKVNKGRFSDMNGHWAFKEVEKLAELSIINGFPDGSFMPEQSVTRAEFSKMICIAMKFDLSSGENPFNDVNISDWFSDYVITLAEKEIVNGYTENLFAPNDKISREDAAVIVWRATGSPKLEGSVSFLDENNIADYARDGVLALGSLKIINGYDGRFNPKSYITRAEAVKILYNILEIEK